MAALPLRADSAQVTHLPAFLARYDRAQVEAFVEVAIAYLDTLDGDPEAEPNGDENDWAWSEWDGRPAFLMSAGIEADAQANCGLSEDDEEDDPCGVYDEDGVNTATPGGNVYTGPGCPISDPDGVCDRDAMQPYIRRLRNSRCTRVVDPRFGERWIIAA